MESRESGIGGSPPSFIVAALAVTAAPARPARDTLFAQLVSKPLIGTKKIGRPLGEVYIETFSGETMRTLCLIVLPSVETPEKVERTPVRSHVQNSPTGS